MNSKKPIEYVEPEIPSEFKLKYQIANGDNVLRDSYETWRIFALDTKTGELWFMGNNTSDDWKSERNAKERADWFNRHNTRAYPDTVFVVKKCRVTIEEIA